MAKKKVTNGNLLEPALALVEFDSIAAGIHAADSMVKRAPIYLIKTGTVQPGNYLVLIGGEVADVEEALAEGRDLGGSHVLDYVYLPQVHREVVSSIGGGRVPEKKDSLGVIETSTVAAAILAADAGIKGAEVRLLEVRLADGLGGKGIVLFSGLVADVEAAVEIGVGVLAEPGLLVWETVIPQLHAEIWNNLGDATRFRTRVIDQL